MVDVTDTARLWWARAARAHGRGEGRLFGSAVYCGLSPAHAGSIPPCPGVCKGRCVGPRDAVHVDSDVMRRGASPAGPRGRAEAGAAGVARGIPGNEGTAQESHTIVPWGAPDLGVKELICGRLQNAGTCHRNYQNLGPSPRPSPTPARGAPVPPRSLPQYDAPGHHAAYVQPAPPAKGEKQLDMPL